jgi:CSLREA domain-containing protein
MSGYLSRSLRAAFVIGAVLALIGVGQSATSVDAATFTVTKTADTADGTCDADCSLREAIIAANAAAGADTVTVPAGTYNLTIAGQDEDAAATGDLDITDDLTLSGAGAGSTVIDGGAFDRVLDVDPSATAAVVEISGVTVQNGSVGGSGAGLRNRGSLALRDSTFTGNDSVFSHGGAIQNNPPPADALTVENVTIMGNSANNGFGGGIDNRGDATLTNVTVSGNSAGGGGGGIHDFGGAMTLIDSTVSGNTVNSGSGGGIFLNSNSTLTVDGSAVSGNTTPDTGGGVHNEGELTIINGSTITGNTSALVTGGIHLETGSSMTMANSEVSNNDPEGIILDGGSSASVTGSLISGNAGSGFNVTGTLVLSDSLVSNNSVAGNGGGIDVSGGVVTITGSTFSGNSANDGGAIFSNGTVELTNSTISGNTATGLGGGGILNNVVADLTATNVTVAGNSPDGIHSFGSATVTTTIVADGCAGTSAITSGGHNLDNDGSCALGAAGDTTGDPRLSALADNGGPTQTHALQADSPAIDTADDVNCPLVDQRGVARPVDGDLDGTATCDVGAYELEVAAATPTPKSAPTPAELPETGGEPVANGRGVMALALPLLAAAAIALGTWGVVIITRQQRGRR